MYVICPPPHPLFLTLPTNRAVSLSPPIVSGSLILTPVMATAMMVMYFFAVPCRRMPSTEEWMWSVPPQDGLVTTLSEETLWATCMRTILCNLPLGTRKLKSSPQQDCALWDCVQTFCHIKQALCAVALNTVGPQLSVTNGTEALSDKWNCRICEASIFYTHWQVFLAILLS